MAEPPRQRIRPGLAELRSLPAEYDFEDEDEDVPTYAPSATVRREPPPEIGISQGQPSRKPGTSHINSNPKNKSEGKVRFDLNFGESSLEDDNDPSPAGPSIAALVGSIQERMPLQSLRRAGREATHGGQSKFAVQRHLDRDAGILNGDFRSRNVQDGPTAVGSHDDEEWLDDEGHPLSAFKKKQLISKGLRPAKIRSKDGKADNAVVKSLEVSNEDEGVQSMMKSISAENEAKIASMTYEEIEQDLRELKESLGSHLLERLKNRAQAAPSAARDESNLKSKEIEGTAIESTQSLSTSEIRDKYFPQEAIGLPASLKWTQDMSVEGTDEEEGITRHRFNFDGTVMNRPDIDDQDTIAAGLHHHGEQQDRPGYTTAELLYLARSTLPGQRIMALQTLTRILSRHMTRIERTQASQEVVKNLVSDSVVDQACFIASWYIESRQNSVRSVALTCINTCLAITLRIEESEALVEASNESIASEGRQSKVPALTDYKARESLSLVLLQTFQLPDASPTELTSAVTSLTMMTRTSRELCAALMAHPKSIQQFVAASLVAQPWPTRGETTHLSLAALELVNTLIAGHRSTAVKLYESGLPNTLIRFLSISPWSVEENGVRAQAWQHMLAALRILTSFGKYGIGADLYGRSHALFLGLQDWMAKPDIIERKKDDQDTVLEVLAAAFDLYAVWTICATDAHQTYAHHDITFSQVSEWQEIGMDGLASLESMEGGRCSVNLTFARAAALRLLESWRECASKNTKQAAEFNDTQSRVISVAARLIHDRCVALLDDGPRDLSIGLVDRLASSYRSARPFEAGNKSSRIIRLILDRLVTYHQRSHHTGSQRSACENLFDLMLKQDPQSNTLVDWLRLLISLPSGCEDIAKKVIFQHLPSHMDLSSKEAINVLEPFFNELTRPRQLEKGAPGQITPSTLRSTDTLFLIISCTQDGSSDVDPISQAPLWRSPNSGLPLRLDWPLVVLDDLLHSGNCAALNRPNVLPPEWDANEAQIVEAALSLSVALWQSDNFACSPSAEEIYVGIMKVFMLEEQQLENSRASGRITGRDIYRREAVTRALTQLYDIANKLQLDTGDTLEAVVDRQFGKALPFYQFYTSLVGLYDGISFGFEPFARSLVIPLQMQYAADYRRLLWADYAHCLSTVSTSIEHAPGGFHLYVNQVEKDETVIRAMTVALMSNYVDKTRTELLFAIAIQQLGALLWSDTETTRSSHLIGTFFHDRSTPVPPHLNVVRQELLRWTPSHGAVHATQDVINTRLRHIEAQMKSS